MSKLGLLKTKGIAMLIALCSLFSILAVVSLGILRPSAISSLEIEDINYNNDSIINVAEHTYQIDVKNCDFAKLTNNFTMTESALKENISFEDGAQGVFGFYMNYNREISGTTYWYSGIALDAGSIAAGAQRSVQGTVKIRIPEGVYTVHTYTADELEQHFGTGSADLLEMAKEYYDLRVTFSNFKVETIETFDNKGTYMHPGYYIGDGNSDTNTYYKDNILMLIGTDFTYHPITKSGGNINTTGWADWEEPMMHSMALHSYSPTGKINDRRVGLTYDIKFEVIPRNTSNWQSVDTVPRGTVSMLFDDLDYPDMYEWWKIRTTDSTTRNAVHAAAGDPSGNLSDSDAKIYEVLNSNSNFSTYNGKYKESIYLKDGIVGSNSSTGTVYMYSGNNCTLRRNDGVRISNGGGPCDDSRRYTCVTFLGNAKGFTIGYSASHCSTRLFEDFGTYTVTIKRTDTYGSAAGSLMPGQTDNGSTYEGAITVFPGTDLAMYSSAVGNYVIDSYKVDGTPITQYTMDGTSFKPTTGVRVVLYPFFDKGYNGPRGVYANHDIEVSLRLEEWNITTEVINGTIVPVDGHHNIPTGESREVTYNPKPGYKLSYIEIDGSTIDTTGVESRYMFSNIDADHHIKVVYEPVYQITTEVINGDIDDPIYDIPAGSRRTITYNPWDGYWLFSITVDGTEVDTVANASRYVFDNINANHHIKVVYKPMYNIYTSVIHGGIDPDIHKIMPGETKTIKYWPDEGYYLATIEIDGEEIDITGHESNYTFRDINEDHWIHVVYEPMAKIHVESVSNAPAISNGNSLYHFAGLKYEIRDKNGVKVDEITANRQGTYQSSKWLVPGEYTVVSINDNGCYKEAVNTEVVTLSAGDEKYVTMKHPPVNDPVPIVVDKDWA